MQRLDEITIRLRVLSATEGLQWYGSPEDEYFVPNSDEQIRSLQAYLQSLQDGSYLPVRGRDFGSDGTSNVTTAWDYGVATKSGSRLFFLYETGDIESLPIKAINYKMLVHFCIANNSIPRQSPVPPPNPNRVVLINHGWSNVVGPDYALIRSLESVAVKLGWKAVVPDFRPSYRFGETRGRAERIRLIYEELICLGHPKPETVVLVGHSQGGACSSLACTDRVVKHANVKGLLLLGSESPLSLDDMDWIPKVPHCMIVHAEKDTVISISEMRKVALRWGLPLHELDSTVEKGARDCWGDDVHHDFLAKDLLTQVVALFENFLAVCQGTNQDSYAA